MGGVRERFRSLRERVRSELVEALTEKHTPRQVAGSFALGVFITALPTLGTGLLLFVAIVALFASVSKLALFASVIVLNPVAKWGVYGVSFWLGSEILGPIEGVGWRDVSLSAAPDVVARLLVGNLILAVVLTVVAYVTAYRLTAAYRRRNDQIGYIERLIE